jgi:hypothetical protein
MPLVGDGLTECQLLREIFESYHDSYSSAFFSDQMKETLREVQTKSDSYVFFSH